MLASAWLRWGSPTCPFINLTNLFAGSYRDTYGALGHPPLQSDFLSELIFGARYRDWLLVLGDEAINLSRAIPRP